MKTVFSVDKYEEKVLSNNVSKEEIQTLLKGWPKQCNGKTLEECKQIVQPSNDIDWNMLWKYCSVSISYDVNQVFELQQIIWKQLTDEQREYWYCVGTIEYTLYVLRLCGVDIDRISQDEFEYAANMSFDVEEQEESHT